MQGIDIPTVLDGLTKLFPKAPTTATTVAGEEDIAPSSTGPLCAQGVVQFVVPGAAATTTTTTAPASTTTTTAKVAGNTALDRAAQRPGRSAGGVADPKHLNEPDQPGSVSSGPGCSMRIVTGPSLTSATAMSAPKRPVATDLERTAPRPPIHQRLGDRPGCRVRERRPPTPRGVRVQRELTHDEHRAADVEHRTIHLGVVVLEDPQGREPLGERVGIGR
jgi:hypothetical protein